MPALFEQLLYTAQKSPMISPHACIIVLRNKIIATGFNSYETNKCRLENQCLL